MDEENVVKITTETGSTYTIKNGLCVKTSSKGNWVDTFKLWTMKPVPEDIATWEELHSLPEGDPVLGERLYLAGKDVWWVSTRVVSITQLAESQDDA
jgi:hypothetical protein